MKNWRRHGINLDKSGKTIIINSVMDISNKKSPCYTQHTQGMTGQFILILWWEDCITIHCGPAHLRGVELRFGLNTATPSSANWAAASPLLSSTLSSAAVWGGFMQTVPMVLLSASLLLRQMASEVLSTWKLLLAWKNYLFTTLYLQRHCWRAVWNLKGKLPSSYAHLTFCCPVFLWGTTPTHPRHTCWKTWVCPSPLLSQRDTFFSKFLMPNNRPKYH